MGQGDLERGGGGWRVEGEVKGGDEDVGEGEDVDEGDGEAEGEYLGEGEAEGEVKMRVRECKGSGAG